MMLHRNQGLTLRQGATTHMEPGADISRRSDHLALQPTPRLGHLCVSGQEPVSPQTLQHTGRDPAKAVGQPRELV